MHEGVRQEKRGRPGPDTRCRKTHKTIFTLTFKVGHHKVAYDAATDGCLPLVSNDCELLPAYRHNRISRSATSSSKAS